MTKKDQIQPNITKQDSVRQVRAREKYRNVFPILSMGSGRKETTDLQIMTKLEKN